MKNNTQTTNELSPEALTLLRDLNVNVGAGYRCTKFDDLIDDAWLEEFIEDYRIG